MCILKLEILYSNKYYDHYIEYKFVQLNKDYNKQNIQAEIDKYNTLQSKVLSAEVYKCEYVEQIELS